MKILDYSDILIAKDFFQVLNKFIIEIDGFGARYTIYVWEISFGDGVCRGTCVGGRAGCKSARNRSVCI